MNMFVVYLLSVVYVSGIKVGTKAITAVMTPVFLPGCKSTSRYDQELYKNSVAEYPEAGIIQ